MEGFQRVFSVKSKIKNYSIFTVDTISDFNLFISDFDLIIADTNVSSHLNNSLKNIIFFDCSEHLKTWEHLSEILDIFIEYDLNKKSKIIIIGGGTLQDAVSFCCSIYNRGIPFCFAPTTLLSMCDSCIGGKTSINYSGFKNKLGNYFPPDKIFLFKDFINTLNENEILSGLGEIFKFHILRNGLKKDFLINTKNITQKTIIDSLIYKSKIIERDEFDSGERLKLNYGHTFGHALESTSNYKIPHGLAVVVGINIANFISYKMKFLNKDSYYQIKQMSKKLISNLSLNKSWFDMKKLMPIIEKDKKNISGIRMMIMCDSGFDLKTMNSQDLFEIVNEFIETEI